MSGRSSVAKPNPQIGKIFLISCFSSNALHTGMWTSVCAAVTIDLCGVNIGKRFVILSFRLQSAGCDDEVTCRVNWKEGAL